MSEPLLYGYQRAWLADASRYKLGMFARQTGKTFTTTLEIARGATFADAAGLRENWVILSRGERQAREAMQEGVHRHAQALGAAVRAVEIEWRGDATYKALEAIWPNGSKVTALPANPDTARGFSRNVFLDEFAFHRDSRAIWKALFPVISAGYKLRVVSTPNGKGNKFYDLATGGQVLNASPSWLASGAGLGADRRPADRWSRHVIDIHEAVRQGLPRDIDELREGMGDPEAWSQEYELQWVDEASAWLPYELIDGCEDPAAGLPDAYSGGLCYLGMDIAARGDMTVIWCLEQIGDVLWARERVELSRAPFATQLDELDRLVRTYRVSRIALDQTGMGEAVVEQAKRAHGDARALGVLFTPAAKLDMATRLKDRMEDRRLRLPLGDGPLRADLHSVQRQVGPTGIPRLTAEREGGSHADRFWSLALAVSAASDSSYTIEWAPAASHPAGAWRDRPDQDTPQAARDFRGRGW